MKKYIPQIYCLLISPLLWVLNLSYFEIVSISMYALSGVYVYQLKGKATITKPLILMALIVMGFATGAQLLGYNTFSIWTIPDQHLILGKGLFFPFEEWLYWYGGLNLFILQLKHLEVYHYDLVANFTLRVRSFFNRGLLFPFVRIQIHVSRSFMAVLITAFLLWPYLFNLEARCVDLEHFVYNKEQLKIFIFGVPLAGALMYPLVPFFEYSIYRLLGGRSWKINNL